LLLFLSGAAALVYQSLWIKQLSLVVGVDVYAVSTAVSAFFAGLALGGFLFGPRVDASSRPLRLFAGLELAVATIGVLATLGLSQAAEPFVRLERVAGPLAWLLPFLLVGIPATFMGGTLPAVLRASDPGAGHVGRRGGVLYAANTAGAVAGVLAMPFVLVPAFGVRGSAFAAAAMNVAAALLAFIRERSNHDVRTSFEGSAGRASAQPVPGITADARAALGLYAIAGGIALGYEVVWSHVVVQFVSTRVFAFSIMLATYLTGLAIGSALYARFADRVSRPWTAFGSLIAAAGLAALAAVALAGPWIVVAQTWLEVQVLALTGNALAGMCARFLVAAFGVVALPATLLGAAFPAALRLAAGPSRVGRDTGALLAVNTLGGIAGTLVTGFVLLPALGIIRTLGVLAIGASILGIVAATKSRGRARHALFAVAAAAVVLTWAVPRDRLARLPIVARGGTLQFYAESAAGTVSVVEQGASPTRFRRLYIQGVSNSGDTLTSLRYMRLQALLPLIAHPGEPKAALVIGFGTGITAGALLQYPGLERRVCAELLPAVVEAASLFTGNYGAPAGLDLRVRDGRRELLASDERYDLITLEPPPPSAAGVVNLYSRDFYRLARRRLTPDGVLAQWWPLPTQNDEDSRALVRAFLDEFRQVSVWTTELHEMLLIGSVAPMPLDYDRIRQRIEQPAVRRSLAEVGIASADALLATWIAGRAELERYTDTSRPVTDDDPRIEYATWVRPREVTRVLPRLLEVSTVPELVGADADAVDRVALERARLHGFYRAALEAYAGARAGAAEGLRAAITADPDNPYYRWFTSQRGD
jgi:predicted membrane-bound spermidine synthase